MSDNLLSAEQLAQALGVRPQTVRLWAREGRIPEICISPKVRRFSYPDVLAALKNRSTQRNTEGRTHD